MRQQLTNERDIQSRLRQLGPIAVGSKTHVKNWPSFPIVRSAAIVCSLAERSAAESLESFDSGSDFCSLNPAQIAELRIVEASEGRMICGPFREPD